MENNEDILIAVLALQGAFIEHIEMLQHLRCSTIEIRQLADWQHFLTASDTLKAIVLPGGESTTMMRLLNEEGLFAPIKEAITYGMPVMGTCAGMILLSNGRLGTLNVEVKRNAYGRQLGSFNYVGNINGIGDNIPMTFIRAPYVEKICGEAEAIAEVDGHIVAVRQDYQLACSFHPELTKDTRWHEHFIHMIRKSAQ